MTIWLNGNFVSKDEARISVYDHGLLYGDGIFEGIRAYRGKIFRLKAHMDRLYNGAKALLLEPPRTRADIEELLHDAVRREAEAGNPDSYIRLIITRGEGPLGLDPFSCETPGLIIIVDRIRLYPAEYYEHGVPVVTSAMRRNAADCLDPRIKSLNYLNNIVARIQARQAGAQEALLLNHEGYVAECTGDNIVTVKNGVIRVPASHYGALEGITLAAVLEIAADVGYQIEKTGLTLYDIYCADEIFLTGTGAEMVPVAHVDGRKPNEGAQGPVFMRLRSEFQRRIVDQRSWFEGR